MAEMMFEQSDYEASRRESQLWAYDRMAHEQAERDLEDRSRGYVDIGGYNVPYRLQSLVLEHGVHPDKVCAVAGLFDSTEDFIGMREDDPRRAEVEISWARIEADEIARQQSGLFPER